MDWTGAGQYRHARAEIGSGRGTVQSIGDGTPWFGIGQLFDNDHVGPGSVTGMQFSVDRSPKSLGVVWNYRDAAKVALRRDAGMSDDVNRRGTPTADANLRVQVSIIRPRSQHEPGFGRIMFPQHSGAFQNFLTVTKTQREFSGDGEQGFRADHPWPQ